MRGTQSGAAVLREILQGRLGRTRIERLLGVSQLEARKIAEASKRSAREALDLIRKCAPHLALEAAPSETIDLEEPAALFFIGDQHLGSPGVDEDRIFEEATRIARLPSSYVLLLGDLVDNMIPKKLASAAREATDPVWLQWTKAKDYIDIFANKLIGIIGGNHEYWTYMAAGVDMLSILTASSVLYDAHELKLNVRCSGRTWRIWARHRWLGSSIYNQTHGQERAARFADARFHVYVGAHTHTGSVVREFTLHGERKIAIQVGSYKESDEYAKRIGLPEADRSSVACVIFTQEGLLGLSDLDMAEKIIQMLHAAPKATPVDTPSPQSTSRKRS